MDFINIIGTIIDNSINHVVTFAHYIRDSRLKKNQQDINEDVYNKLDLLEKSQKNLKGYYVSYESLTEAIPNPEKGNWAVINNNGHWIICVCITEGIWTLTEDEYEVSLDLSEYITNQQLNSQLNNYATKDELDNKLNSLLSGVNIKTINDISILGPGNINILQWDLHIIQLILENIQALLTLIQNESGQIADITEVIERYNEIVNFINLISENTLWHFGDPFPVVLSEKHDNAFAKIIFDIEDIKSKINALENNTGNNNTQQDISELIEKYNEIKEFVDLFSIKSWHFGDPFPIILSEQNNNNIINEITSDIENIKNRIKTLENNTDGITNNEIRCEILNQKDYNALSNYEDNVIYFIIEYGLGKFPVILT